MFVVFQNYIKLLNTVCVCVCVCVCVRARKKGIFNIKSSGTYW